VDNRPDRRRQEIPDPWNGDVIMVNPSLTSFALRPRRGMPALIVALVVLTAVGCNHRRRAALRPVFVNPAPACSTPATLVPEAVVPAPTTTVTPSAVESYVPSSPEPSASTLGAPAEPAPSAYPEPALTEPAPSAAPGPPPSRSSAVEEQELLDPVPPNNTNNSNFNNNSQTPSSLTVPRLQPPGTSLNNGRRATPARLRRVSLRERLSPYTNNPDDLFAPPKADRPWKYVVLHHSATPSGSYETIDHEHRKRLGWDGCGYHFVIGNGHGSPDGLVEVARRWSDQKNGVHCRDGKNPDVNEYGIGICLVGDLDNAPPTPRQIAAAKALVTYLGARYRISADHIDTHAHLASSPTACPGKNFPVQAILGSNTHIVQR
jgi:hypothetical protein